MLNFYRCLYCRVQFGREVELLKLCWLVSRGHLQNRPFHRCDAHFLCDVFGCALFSIKLSVFLKKKKNRIIIRLISSNYETVFFGALLKFQINHNSCKKYGTFFVSNHVLELFLGALRPRRILNNYSLVALSKKCLLFF